VPAARRRSPRASKPFSRCVLQAQSDDTRAGRDAFPLRREPSADKPPPRCALSVVRCPRCVPMALLEPDVSACDALLTVNNANLWTFGVLSSRAFSVWNSAVSGRLKSDYRVSVEVAYSYRRRSARGTVSPLPATCRTR
jgi:hypothetical protein